MEGKQKIKMKNIILFVVTLGLLISPVVTNVNSVKAVDVQSQIDLMAQLNLQIQALKTQLGQLSVDQQTNISVLAKNLGQGSSGDDVKILQAILAADASIYGEGLITGYFGPATARAVAKFQAKYGINATGFVGPLTRAKIKAEFDDTVGLEADAMGTKRPCVKIPPGHLIAPGWLRKHDGVRPIVPTCQKLPEGISNKIEGSAVISAVATANLTAGSATISWTTNEAATSKVYYSAATPVNLSTSLTVSDNAYVTAHSLNLVNLSANTTYYFVVESRDTDGNVSVSAESSFMTNATADATAPTISGVAASSISANGTTINWTTNESATGKVYYSTTSPVDINTAASVSANVSATNQSANLVGLSANTTYYFVVQARDASGNTSVSASYVFTTSASTSGDTTPPTISSVGVMVTVNAAVVTWITNESATGKVYYSTTTPVNTASAQFVASADLSVNHSLSLTGLSANTTYYIVIESKDGSNNASMSTTYQFTTGS